MRMAAAVRPRMTGSTVIPPKTRAGSEHLGKPVGAPDQREACRRREQRMGAAHPGGKHLARSEMGKAALRIGRDILPRRIVERRVHQDPRETFRKESSRGKFPLRCGDVERRDLHAVAKGISQCIVAGKVRERGIEFNQCDGKPHHP